MKPGQWGLRGDSTRRVALDVLLHGPLARTELARRANLSTASLSRLTKPLIDSGLLVEVDDIQPEPTGGRPLQPLDVDPRVAHFVGVKLTADAAYAAVTDLRAVVVTRGTAPIDSHEPSVIGGVIAELTRELADGLEIEAVGVCLGGAVSDYHIVRRAAFLGWENVDLSEEIAPRVATPIVASNDLESLLEAERWFGAGREVGNFAVLTTGPGVGCGLVVNDGLVTSPDAGFGLVGHQLIDANGPLCAEGHRGCAAVLLSMDSIERLVSEALGRSVTFDQALDLTSAGDPEAERIVSAAARAYGLLIAMVANIGMPQKVILTGEGWRLAAVGAAALAAGLREGRHPLAAPLELEVLPDDPYMWARGAAAVAIQRTIAGVLPPPS
ncbi:MAG: ROK family transcriptional regulator [Actinobacteria bacterium]|nr:ROK family transcriptional regulator [Actinomycetota bacterium]